MKKVFCIQLVSISFVAQAQNKVAAGLKGGWNHSTIQAEGLEYAAFDPRSSFHLGGLVHIPLNKQWALQPELLYSSQGAEFNTTYDADDVPGVHNRWHINYFTIPLLVQYHLVKGLRVQTGAQVGFLLGAKTIENTDYEQDIESMLKGTDYAWVVGTGYQTTMGVGISVRYALGLTNINESIFIPATSIKNRVLQVSLSYQFGRRQNQ